MKTNLFLFSLFLLWVTACTGGPSKHLAKGVPRPTVTPSPTSTPTSTPTPAPTATPTVTATPTIPTPDEVFRLVSPAIAFLETPAGSGSGVLIEGGYVVTNAHVVWPFRQVRVVFPDGSEFLETPVLNWDLMTDLALVGPIQTTIPPLTLTDGEAEVTGSEVYLVGYPGEVEHFPQPTITRGLIARLREWEALGITYFQTDAMIAAGQSGGALVSRKGEVIGISGFSFTEAMFGLVASAADIQPHLDHLLTGEAPHGLGRRCPEQGDEAASRTHRVWLAQDGDIHLFLLNEPAGTDLNIRVEGEVAATVEVIDAYGSILSGSATTTIAGPHFVLVYPASAESGYVRVSSSHLLTPCQDEDDNQRVGLDQTQTGSLDYSGDFDYFPLSLHRGETVQIRVSSLLIDAYLVVMHPSGTLETAVKDDNSGGGLFGLDAEVVYQAPETGTYYLIVADAVGFYTGGYFLDITQPDSGAPTPVSPEPTPTPVGDPAKAVATYESSHYPFSMQYPEAWELLPNNILPCTNLMTACFGDTQDLTYLMIQEQALPAGTTMSLAQLAETLLTTYQALFTDLEVVSQEQITTAQGQTAEAIVVSIEGGSTTMSLFVYLHEGQTAFVALYLVPSISFDNLEPLIAYSFASFTVK